MDDPDCSPRWKPGSNRTSGSSANAGCAHRVTAGSGVRECGSWSAGRWGECPLAGSQNPEGPAHRFRSVSMTCLWSALRLRFLRGEGGYGRAFVPAGVMSERWGAVRVPPQIEFEGGGRSLRRQISTHVDGRRLAGAFLANTVYAPHHARHR